jgi:competence protein ComEA
VSVASSKVRVTAALVVAMAAVALASHGSHSAEPRVHAASFASPPSPTTKEVADGPSPERPATRALREGRPLDLNRASEADLVLLPGIGPSLARRIVESRSADGPFPDVEALDRVRGIGRRTVERLRPLLHVERASVRIPEDTRPQPGGDRHEVDGIDVPDG